MSYGTRADGNDEYCRMLETVLNKALHKFCNIVVNNFSEEYLNRYPTKEEKKRYLDVIEKRGFKGCFGSWDCKYFVWDNYPQHQAGSYKGCSSSKTIIIETIINPFTYIWNTCVSKPRLINNINVLDRSDIIESI